MTFAKLFLSAMTMVAVTAAHPAHMERRVASTETKTVVSTMTDPNVSRPTTVPQVAIYFDGKSSAVRTTTELVLLVPAGTSAITTTTLTRKATVTYTVSPFAKTTSSPSETNKDSTKGSASPPWKNGTSSLPGISYAPYRKDHQCKSAEDIMDDFDRFEGLYSLVRIYGTDCGQVPIIYKAAKKCGMKLFLGIWDINSVADEASKIISGIDGDWDIVHTVSVGNELVNGNKATPQQVIGAVKETRPILRAAGFKGPVVTVDTFIAVEKHPELCEESDYCAVNAHAYFDSTSSAEQAGPWLVRTVDRVKAALSTDKHVVITKSGWPTIGEARGLAVAGLNQQKSAIQSMKESFKDNASDLILFSAYNDLWKTEAERHWGIDGAVSKCDE